MKTVFADTFYFLAILNPSDGSHEVARGWTAKFRGQIITTTWVLAEIADGSARSRDRATVAEFLQGLLNRSDVVVLAPNWAQFLNGLELYGNRLDKEWSLTDCISFEVMQRERIREALTGDHHFEQAGFTILFPK